MQGGRVAQGVGCGEAVALLKGRGWSEDTGKYCSVTFKTKQAINSEGRDEKSTGDYATYLLNLLSLLSSTRTRTDMKAFLVHGHPGLCFTSLAFWQSGPFLLLH